MVSLLLILGLVFSALGSVLSLTTIVLIGIATSENNDKNEKGLKISAVAWAITVILTVVVLLIYHNN